MSANRPVISCSDSATIRDTRSPTVGDLVARIVSESEQLITGRLADMVVGDKVAV